MGIAATVRWNVSPWRSAADRIEGEFSGVLAWFGEETGSWWAMVRVPGGPRLVEAVSAEELRKAILWARGWPWPR